MGDKAEIHAKGNDTDALPDFHDAIAEQGQHYKWVKAYADGKHSQSELHKHIAEVGVNKAEAIKLMPKIAKRTKGDIVLECAHALGMPLKEGLKLARKAKDPIEDDALKAQLQQMSSAELASLDDDVDLLKEVRKALKGPLPSVLPILGAVPEVLVDKPNMIQWYVETTDPAIAAIHLPTVGDGKKLAETLDKLDAVTPKAWGWLSAVMLQNNSSVGNGLTSMKEGTKNKAAHDQLTALTKNLETDYDKRKADRPAAQADFTKELTGTDNAALVDAAARADGETVDDPKSIEKRFKGQPAGVVCQYLFNVGMYSAEKVKFGIELLHNSKGATMEHVVSVFALIIPENSATALKDDVTRKHLRAIIGRSVGIRTLYAASAEDAHAFIVKDEALREWAYDDDSPKSLLWIAAGSGPGAKLGCQKIKSEYKKDKDWWKKLPADADKEDLRRFTMHSSDDKAVAFIKTTFLNDVQHSIDASENRVDKPSGTIYGGGTLRDGTSLTELRAQAHGPEAEPSLILERLADLNASERKHLLSQPDDLEKIFARTFGNEVRVVELLQPTYAQLAKLPIKDRPQIVDYTTRHGAAEQLSGARHPVAFQQILGDGVSPLTAFPALAGPDTLAKALDDNVELLEWMFEEMDPNKALSLLSRDPARTVAAALMGDGRRMYAGLPAYEMLRKSGREGFDAITKDIKNDKDREQVEEYKEGDAEIDPEATAHTNRIKQANSAGNLVANVEAILDDQKASASEVIAVVQAATPQQQIELLSGDYEKLVRRIARKVKVGPQHVFSGLSMTQLLSLTDGASWSIGYPQPPTAVLHFMENNGSATKAFGKFVSGNYEVAKQWVSELPEGAALTALERQTLDELAEHVTHDVLLQALFKARFDVPLSTNFSLDDAKALWRVLKRLPHAQVDQEVIEHFTNMPLNGPIGQWAPKGHDDEGKPIVHGDVELDVPRMTGNDSHYKRELWMTADEVKAYYKLDDTALQKASDPKSKEAWLEKDGSKYKVKMTSPRQFDATVLHEVGHSVDTLLGDQTELIFGQSHAGWKRYGYDEFEQFADEMGAFDKVSSSKERKQIVEVWQQALRSDVAVNHLVDDSHPALAADTPLQPFTHEREPFTHNDTSLKPINGKIFFQTPTALASMNKKAYDAAPTDYSMTAPAEYFAECYVEYYCRYDGTQNTADKKGGRLPAWIKKWFDENVDAIRFAPERVHKGMGDDKSQ